MEELKRRIKEIVPEENHEELNEIFNSWLTGLKVHTIPNTEENVPEEDAEEGGVSDSEEKVPLKVQVDALKEQIKTFKEKMKVYKESDETTTEAALMEVKEEVERIKQEISKLRMTFIFDTVESRRSENVELIHKLDEVKQFLEKLK